MNSRNRDDAAVPAEQRMVREWHELFGVLVNDSPTIPPEEVAYLRMGLIDEELSELKTAADASDLVEIADALGDLLYVVYGTAVCYGLNMGPIFAEIQRSNMSKGDPAVVRRADGKILKGANWSPPALAAVVEAQRKTDD